jgi:hypothetical protein
MGYSVSYINEAEDIVDDDEIASNSGWAAFSLWSEGLDPDELPALAALGEEGLCDDIEALRSELGRVLLDKQAGVDVELRHVLRRLSTVVEGLPKDAVAFVITSGEQGE